MVVCQNQKANNVTVAIRRATIITISVMHLSIGSMSFPFAFLVIERFIILLQFLLKTQALGRFNRRPRAVKTHYRPAGWIR